MQDVHTKAQRKHQEGNTEDWTFYQEEPKGGAMVCREREMKKKDADPFMLVSILKVQY